MDQVAHQADPEQKYFLIGSLGKIASMLNPIVSVIRQQSLNVVLPLKLVSILLGGHLYFPESDQAKSGGHYESES
jgi:hypothetical protein